MCDNSCYIPLQWSADNTRIFYTSDKEDFGVLDIRTGSKTTLLQNGDCSFWAKALAPNEKWISLDTNCRSEQQEKPFIAPVRDGRVYPKKTMASWARRAMVPRCEIRFIQSLRKTASIACTFSDRIV